MTIEQYKDLISSFNSDEFGLFDPAPFVNANKYKKCSVYPKEAHPRVLFTQDSVDIVRKNLTADENKVAYETYIEHSETPCDGIFRHQNGLSFNISYKLLACIEAKAFRYAMTGEKLYGYQAIYCIKNAILTLDVPKGSKGDTTRDWGYTMYVAGCVYDWCFDLLTDRDRMQIIAGCVNRLGTQMEIVCYDGETNIVPTAQGAVYGHGAEAQLLRDWLSFAIAVSSEAPEIYEFVAGRLFDSFREAQDYFYASGNHWEGAAYGPYRFHMSLFANVLVSRMTDGEEKLFTDKMEDVAITFLHYIRPDSQALRIGDVWGESGTSFYLTSYHNMAFLAGNLYKNSVLKAFAYNGLRDFSSLTYDNNNISAVMLLALNDPTVPHEDNDGLRLTRTAEYPHTALFARSAHNDKNAVMVYMNMPEFYASSHQHMDLGSFQIYYKGILASDSGKYSSWGGKHHMAYNMQTVSANSILVYNPNLENYINPNRPNMFYSGGQSTKPGHVVLPMSLTETLSKDQCVQCCSLGKANIEDNGVYLYSYLGGDMTNAYDKETVDEVTRYMISSTTDSKDHPLIFVTFDRITSKDPSYKKTVLIHSQEEIVTTDDGFIIIKNTSKANNGKLVIQSVEFDTDYRVIGGESKRFWLSDKLGNADVDTTLPEGSVAEYGWGRIEISPQEQNLTDHLLTVMYVTDATNTAAPVKAIDLSTEMLAGTMILGKAIFFPKNEKLLSQESTFTLSEKADCFVAGISAGCWTVYSGSTSITTITVEEGTNLLTFKANAGTYTIKPVD